MKEVAAEEVLPVVHDILRRRYGDLKFLSGQGIAKGQRVEFEEHGKQVRCVIKTSAGGRISFGRRGDGSWSGLSESDRVVVVAPTERYGDDLVVSMFDQKILRDAFEANFAAQEKAEMGHLPNWLAPFHEDDRGPRGKGDGFGDKALWSEPLSAVAALPLSEARPLRSLVGALTIAEAKQGLAKTFGVSPEAVEITIRG